MKHKTYPAYKDSGIDWLGQAPTHWAVKRLRFVAKLNPSKSEVGKLSSNTEVSFLPMEAIGDNGTLNLERVRAIGEVESGYSYFREGDVSIAKITPCFENGKGAVMRGLEKGVGFGTTELIVARPHTSSTTSDYLHWLFISSPFRKIGESHMYGAGGQKRVPDDFVRDFAVALPPLQEQLSIAAFLDRETGKIDTLIAKQERLIELLQEKRQATISHAVSKGLDPNASLKESGVEWLGKVPAQWQVKRFQRCVYVAEGQVNPESSVYSSMALIAPNHIESGTGRLLGLESASDQGAVSGKYLCKSGDVVYSKIRPALRKVCIAPEDCLCSADMYPLRSHSGLTNPFLFWSILSEQFSTLAALESQRVAMPKINRESLKEVMITVPPVEDQNKIVAFLNRETAKIDTVIEKCRRSIDLMRERRSALISAAVSGKIDVRDEADKEAA